MRLTIAASTIERILQLHGQGKRVGTIAATLKIKRDRIESVLKRQRLIEAIADARLIGKDTPGRIARTTERLTLLASRRGPDGRIDWDSVKGYVDVRGEAQADTPAPVRSPLSLTPRQAARRAEVAADLARQRPWVTA